MEDDEAFSEELETRDFSLLEVFSSILLLELETAFAELLLNLVVELLEVTLDEELEAFKELLDLFFCSLELETLFELLDFAELLDALLLLELEFFFSVLLLDFSWLSLLKMTEEEDLLNLTELLDISVLLDEDKIFCFCACSHSSKPSSICWT